MQLRLGQNVRRDVVFFFFFLFSSKIKTSDNIHIRTLKPHTCNNTFKVSLVSRKWLIEKYCYRIRNNPNYPVKALKQDIRSEHVLDVSSQCCTGIYALFEAYLYNNFILKHKGLALKKLMFEARKAKRECKFKKVMEKMKIVDETAFQWCQSRNPMQWSRAYFKTRSKDIWPFTCLNELLPPEIEKKSGRPKVSRRTEPQETEQNLQQGSLKRMGAKIDTVTIRSLAITKGVVTGLPPPPAHMQKIVANQQPIQVSGTQVQPTALKWKVYKEEEEETIGTLEFSLSYSQFHIHSLVEIG
ncbi:hypothetical protein M9H77_07631 [Catharanthus roseus]|uniref:Uncharacterized protein n=1 Tax=Catharanthus roseus TaxID=4058 RepID=A0ACC0BVI7_CATRO|nr:hypothetical protein M9H77_07631 [Catharanthus roseus]